MCVEAVNYHINWNCPTVNFLRCDNLNDLTRLGECWMSISQPLNGNFKAVGKAQAERLVIDFGVNGLEE